MAKRRVFPSKAGEAGEVAESAAKRQKLSEESPDEKEMDEAPKARGKKAAANGKAVKPPKEVEDEDDDSPEAILSPPPAKPKKVEAKQEKASTSKAAASKAAPKAAAPKSAPKAAPKAAPKEAPKAEPSTSAPKAESSKSAKTVKGETSKVKKEKASQEDNAVVLAGPKITRENMATNPTRRFYQVLITPEILKDPSFKNLTSLYISSGIWDGGVQASLEKRISEMPRLETLVLKELRNGLKLKISNPNLKNFGLYARELRDLQLETPNLETLAIVHTLHCGTAFFADLMKQVPKLKHLNLWENFGIIQVTTVLPELETMVLSRTSATKLSCQSILENFPALKNIYISSVDITTRTTSAWKKKFGVDVILDATRDFFFEYVVSFGDFEEPEIFHEEQKY